VAVTCGTPRPENAARGAGRSGPDADEHRRGTAFHDLARDVVPDGVSNDHWNLHLPAELFEIERLIFRRKVADCGDGTLDNKNVRPGVLRDCSEFGGPLRMELTAAIAPLSLICLMRAAIKSSCTGPGRFLEQPRDFRFVGFDDFLENLLRFL